MSNKTVILLKNPSTPTDPYHELLLTKSYIPQFIPLLHHTHKDKAQTMAYLKSKEFIDDTNYFIITSQRAVEMLRECIDEIKLENENGHGIQQKILTKVGYTVGPATHKILREVGFVNVRGGIDAGNGSKLADLIMDELTPNTKIAFFTGEVRKDIIPRKLVDVGKFTQFEEFVMYRTCERNDIVDKFNAIVNGGSDSLDGWIVFFSPQGTRDIVQYLKSRNGSIDEFAGSRRWKLASIGPTTEEYLLSSGLIPDVVAAKPDATSLIHGILKCD
ncbi:HEM4 [Candida theae]|uniref:HEM4 n=1 Tax=Candida theae TaxID=1198502 RepID=A0AAD5BAG4_9ASCO|nr:HEM4 [Candida theae]KAI5948709.1 HEM4 [Candida theae]